MFEGATYEVTIRDGLDVPLAAGDTITLTAPVGTEFYDASVLFNVFDAATGQWVPASGVDVHPTSDDFTANEAVLTLGTAVPAETPVHLRVTGVGNPGPRGWKSWSVSTSAQAVPVASAPFHISGAGTVRWGRFDGGGGGSRTYLLYRAPDPEPGRPLIVDLHGCTETAATEARWSRLTSVAAAYGVDVLFPQQDAAINSGKCWNWMLPDNWNRGAGEPALIAGLTRQVAARLHSDPRQIYVSGISAGGIMSDIMAVTYPDLFAAAVVYAGCEYQGLPCFAGPTLQPPHVAASSAAAQMGSRLRVVPVMVIHGTADEVVPVANGINVAQMWLSIAALAAGGTVADAPVPPTRQWERRVDGQETSRIWDWEMGGRLVVRLWLVEGMAHQWSGSADSGTPMDAAIADPDGPDVTTAMLRFLLRHRMPRR
jgi:poly(hydroxyalkanoate) depolymerase family esterase